MAEPSTNFLQANAFRFDCPFLPSMGNWVQAISAPGMGIGTTKVSNPFVPLNIGGDKIDFEGLQLEFKLNETMENWAECVDWLKATGFDGDHSQRADWIKRYGSIKSSGVLSIGSSNYKPFIKITYEDLTPTYVSSFILRTDTSNVQYVACLVDFSYTRWSYTRTS